MAADRTKLPGWLPKQLSPEGPRYLALVNALEQDINDGRLVDGFRLPPHRELSQQLSLSVGTVSKAYQEAELRGIASSHVGQGTFVRRRGPGRREGRSAQKPINMALNVPAEGRATEIIADLLSEVSRSRDLASLMDYHPHGGMLRHREIIATSVGGTSPAVDPARLFLCNGAQHAIDIALRLVARPGDGILVDTLTYSGFKAIGAANDLTLIPITMDGDGADPDALEAAHRSSGAKVFYCLPTLQSPTARTMGLVRRQQIAKLAEKLDLTIIEDDVYGFFFPERPVTLSQLVPDRSFYITSYSKCIAPGFRLGTLTVPTRLTGRAELLLHASSWFVAPLLSEVAVRLIESGKLDELVGERRQQARDRYDIFSHAFPTVDALEFPPFYGWLPLPREWSAVEFTSAARSQGVLITPPIASMVDDIDPGAVRVCLGGAKDLRELSDALSVLQGITSHSPMNVFSVA